jgi:hypothetical protein
MLDLFNIALRTLMCLAFLVWVVRPMLFALTRKEPNIAEIEEVAQIAITSAFQAQRLPDVPLTYVPPPEPVWFTEAKDKMASTQEALPEPSEETPTTEPVEQAQRLTPAEAQPDAQAEEEIDPAEAMRQMREKMKAEQKKAKPTIPPELLQDANSYEDKLMLVRMLVDQEQSRVAGVLKRMIQP